jgi:hypothetical protein
MPCLRLCFYNWGLTVLSSLFHTPFQGECAVTRKKAKIMERMARQCEYTKCGAKTQDGATLHKCAGCRIVLYCCKDHAVRHMPEHESLCKELQRTCDYPTCKDRADTHVKCRLCKMAMYCSKRHRSKHESAHEGRCEELRSLR